jgi:hypothetical protein
MEERSAVYRGRERAGGRAETLVYTRKRERAVDGRQRPSWKAGSLGRGIWPVLLPGERESGCPQLREAARRLQDLGSSYARLASGSTLVVLVQLRRARRARRSQPGDCEGEAVAGKHGAARQSAHLLPMQGAGEGGRRHRGGSWSDSQSDAPHWPGLANDLHGSSRCVRDHVRLPHRPLLGRQREFARGRISLTLVAQGREEAVSPAPERAVLRPQSSRCDGEITPGDFGRTA